MKLDLNKNICMKFLSFLDLRREEGILCGHLTGCRPVLKPFMTYLFGFSSNEIADGFAEEAGQQRIEWGVLFQEVVEDLEKRLVSTQLII